MTPRITTCVTDANMVRKFMKKCENGRYLSRGAWYRNRCLSHVHESTRVRAKFDAFSDLQRPKTGNIMRSYRICLHNTAQFVTL